LSSSPRHLQAAVECHFTRLDSGSLFDAQLDSLNVFARVFFGKPGCGLQLGPPDKLRLGDGVRLIVSLYSDYSLRWFSGWSRHVPLLDAWAPRILEMRFVL